MARPRAAARAIVRGNTWPSMPARPWDPRCVAPGASPCRVAAVTTTGSHGGRDDGAMPQLRLALAQVNATVGDIAGNADIVLDWCRRAADAGADVAVLPEMVLTGYPVEDLALRDSFAAASRRA